jgi:hypothetical protein
VETLREDGVLILAKRGVADEGASTGPLGDEPVRLELGGLVKVSRRTVRFGTHIFRS